MIPSIDDSMMTPCICDPRVGPPAFWFQKLNPTMHLEEEKEKIMFPVVMPSADAHELLGRVSACVDVRDPGVASPTPLMVLMMFVLNDEPISVETDTTERGERLKGSLCEPGTDGEDELAAQDGSYVVWLVAVEEKVETNKRMQRNDICNLMGKRKK